MTNEGFSAGEVVQLFAEETLGGLATGAVLGFVGFALIKAVSDEPKINIMLTLAIAMGGYALCSFIHVSGPLAMVVAALIIGDKLAKSQDFTAEGKRELKTFREVLDEIMNAILFVLIGLEILILSLEVSYVIMSIVAIFIVLLARFLSVMGVIKLFPDKSDETPTKY